MEAGVKYKHTLEGQAQKAILGYARLDLVAHKKKIQFGSWNDCLLQKEQVNRLVQSFLTKGADQFLLMKAILLVVTKKGVKEGMYTMTHSVETTNLPILELEDTAKGKRWLLAAGGQHQLHAIEGWTKILCK